MDDALRIQERFLAYWEQEQIDVAGEFVEHTDFFSGVGMLVKILREKMHFHPKLFSVTDRVVLDSHKSLRLASSAVRLRLCAAVMDALERWPDEFFRIASAGGISRVAVAHCGTAPKWLEAQVALLPQRLRRQYVYRRASLLQRVRQIEAAGGPRCREDRARELLAAAKNWS